MLIDYTLLIQTTLWIKNMLVTSQSSMQWSGILCRNPFPEFRRHHCCNACQIAYLETYLFFYFGQLIWGLYFVQYKMHSITTILLLLLHTTVILL